MIELTSDDGSPAGDQVGASFVSYSVLRICAAADAGLKGKCGRVQSHENGKYKLTLLDGSGGTIRFLQASSLETLTVKEEVDEILKELRLREVQAEVATHSILRLRGLPIDLIVLKETQVGKVLNQLTKPPSRLAANDIFVALGRSLVKRWRDQFRGENSAEVIKQSESEPVDASTSSSSGANPKSSQATRYDPRSSPQILSRDELPSEAFVQVDKNRCQARIWNNGCGGQCSHRRPPAPGGPKEYCTTHQQLLDANGSLPHGRADDVIPLGKLQEFRHAQLQRAREHLLESDTRPPAISTRFTAGLPDRLRGSRRGPLDLMDIPPVATEMEAQKLVEAMRNAPTDRMRLSLLAAIDRTHASQLPNLLAFGALGVLDGWIKDRPDIRFAAMTIVLQLPLDKASARSLLSPTLTKLLQKDAPGEDLAKASAVLSFLNGDVVQVQPTSTSRIETPPKPATQGRSNQENVPVNHTKPDVVARQSPPAVEPPTKKAKIAATEIAPPSSTSGGRTPSAATTATASGVTAPKVTVVSVDDPQPPNVQVIKSSPSSTSDTSVAAACPDELRGLDPRIQAVLRQKPAIIKLLRKHPAIFKNFNKDTIARLGSLLKRSQDSEKEFMQMTLSTGTGSSEDESLRTVTVYDLPLDTIKSDVEALFDDLGVVHVEMPTESRKRKHIGIAYALVESCTIARRAAQQIDGSKFQAAADPTGTVCTIRATLSERTEMEGIKPVSWKSTDELWEVRMFNKELSVDEGIGKHSGLMLASPSEAARSEFREAARREREEEQARLLKGSL